MVNKTHTTTTKVNAKVEQVKLNSPTRLIIYGGAVKASDNSAFRFASLNVVADYKNDLPVKNFFIANGANTVASALEAQSANSVQSLDLFCHGDPDAVYFVIGSSLDKNVENKRLPIASNIYKSKLSATFRGFWDDEKKMKNQYAIANLKLSAFVNESKIEIHGCNTGRGDDCFASELSKQLFEAGKTSSVVIGHASKANPNIGGTTSVTKQDYRHGTRIIYHNGKAIKTVTSSGRIAASIIKSALGK
ncbi:hypothetical protein ACG9XS_20925 [Acinetobacter gyllenbergii]|uniref:hypothetical protein n=1 Tax=Acinetobacter gyllenbergii TaxID=134534 RepID=UPI0003BE9579|nr:hypothetical protein [Acinetobacter gyllenbergii]ESK35399.1 hypothetical protein F987_04311 [Acinetobacter gyllenbergii NIPH 230]